MFTFFSRHNCQLQWKVEEKTTRNVVFVLAGKDQGGMWHLVKGNITGHNLEVSSRFGVEYPTVALIAVGHQGALDILMMNIPSFQKCVNDDFSSTNSYKTTDLLIVIILCCIVLSLSVVLLWILCSWKKDQRRPQTEMEKSLRRLKLSSNNTYVDLSNAHLYEDIIWY